MANFIIWSMLLLFIMKIPEAASSPIVMPDISYVISGDVYLGAIFGVYDFSLEEVCGDQISHLVLYHFMQAAVYALDKINKDATLLPNITLGLVILDDCRKTEVALARTLQFSLNDNNNNGKQTILPDNIDLNTSHPLTCSSFGHTYNVVGIVGAIASERSAAIARLLSLFRTPQISPVSTSDDLTDKAKYPYFFRVVPPDTFKVRSN